MQALESQLEAPLPVIPGVEAGVYSKTVQITPAGALADGTTLDLSGFYVVFTSNIASAEMVDLRYSSYATMERHVLSRAQQTLRPELFARITEKLVFNRLSYEDQLESAADLVVAQAP